MLLRIGSLAMLLMSCNPSAPAQAAEAGAGARSGSLLDARFAAAEADPAQVVTLILEVSEHLNTLDGNKGHALGGRLEPFCRRAFFTPERLPGMERLGLRIHEVSKGEIPGRIARRYGMGTDFFRYLNQGYDERKLQIGHKLKVLDLSNGALRLIVDKERYRLGAWRRVDENTWVLLAYLPVGLGAQDSPTPSGSSTITKRVLDPEWTDPKTREVFAPGDPGNVLGGYWMALDAIELGVGGIGLHGFTGAAPADWIERPASAGCVRLLQDDMDRIFHLAVTGTPVIILP